MIKKKLSIVLAIFFLVQVCCLSQNLGAEVYALHPASRISEQSLQQASTAYYLTITAYEKELFSPAFRYEIENEAARLNSNGVRLDFDNMSRDGLICLYPVTIGGKSFLMKIFMTAKNVEAPGLRIIDEMNIDSPPVTCQVLPCVNDILKDCRIKPDRIYNNTEAARSP